MKSKEKSIIVDENDNILEIKPRDKVSKKDRMRNVVVWLEDGKGNVLIHKRTMTKKSGPGLWENAAGGGVSYGETYEEAAYKELEEELGVSNIKLTLLTKNFFDGTNGPKACAWYTGVTKLKEDEFDIEPKEVEFVK